MGINWQYNLEDFTEEQIGDNYGFVYKITNLKTGKKYIRSEEHTSELQSH